MRNLVDNLIEIFQLRLGLTFWSMNWCLHRLQAKFVVFKHFTKILTNFSLKSNINDITFSSKCDILFELKYFHNKYIIIAKEYTS